MSWWTRFLKSTRDRILDRCVLQPTTDFLPVGNQKRCRITLPNDWVIECFVHLDPSDQHRQIVEPEMIATSAFDHLTPPDDLVVKFPGTGGRGERSTVFPGDLIRGMQTNRSTPVRMETWTWNPPGYGNSTGRITLRGLTSVAQDWLTMLTRMRCGPETRIWLVGNSLGCLPALYLGRVQQNPKLLGLWIRNPPPLKLAIPHVASRYGAGRLFKSMASHLPDDLDPIVSASQCSLPTVYLTSQLDDLVKPQWQSQIVSAHSGPAHQVILHDLAHDGLIDESHQGVIEDAMTWLLDATSVESKNQ
ncbi:MAG: alpha/beta hydrolase [Planctomycetota bacterium]